MFIFPFQLMGSYSYLVPISAYPGVLYVCSTEGAVYLSGSVPSLHLLRFTLGNFSSELTRERAILQILHNSTIQTRSNSTFSTTTIFKLVVKVFRPIILKVYARHSYSDHFKLPINLFLALKLVLTQSRADIFSPTPFHNKTHSPQVGDGRSLLWNEENVSDSFCSSPESQQNSLNIARCPFKEI